MKRMAIKSKFLIIIVLFVSIAMVMQGMIYLQGRVHDGIRGYVRGEGLWAKAQKEATLNLTKYIYSQRAEDYAAFLEALDVPFGDKQARLTLDSDHPDMEVARAGFIAGNNAQQDVETMIWFFLNFRNVSYMRNAINIWAEGDNKINELVVSGEELHGLLTDSARDPERIVAAQLKINKLNEELLVLENHFSTVLSDAGRDVSNLLSIASVLLLAAFSGIAISISTQIIKGIAGAEKRLILSESRFTSLKNSNSIGIVAWDTDGNIEDANDYFLDMLGYSQSDITDKKLNWRAMTPLEMRDRDLIALAEIAESGSCTPFEKALTDINGRPVPIYLGATIVRGEEEHGIAYVMDLTQKKQDEEKIKLASIVFDTSSEGIIITDPALRIISVNQAMCDMSGYKQSELIGNSPKMMQSGHTTAEQYTEMWESLIATGFWQGDVFDRRKDGALLPVHLSLSAEKDDKGKVTHYVAIISDISERRANEERLRQQAQHDMLTGLPNRVLLNDRLEQALIRAQRNATKFALLFLDLDNFKPVNDQYGHAVGDRILQCIAQRLKDAVRSSDTVTRLGGDEFVVLMEEVSDVGLVDAIAAKISQVVLNPCDIDGVAINVGISIGISIYPNDGGDIHTLFHHADLAMYAAKHLHREKTITSNVAR